MDDADMLQRPGGDLPGVDRRGCATRGSAARARAVYRPAVPFARGHHDTHLHGRLALLRRKSVAGFSEHRPANLTRRGSLAYYLAAWVCGTFFFVLAALFSSDHHWRYGNWLGLGIFSAYFLGLARSEEHTSELQSRLHLVCRLLLEKKKKSIINSQLASNDMRSFDDER